MTRGMSIGLNAKKDERDEDSGSQGKVLFDLIA
jgi:hypothetical protein